ncbi:MAG: hypothetical protein K2K39_01940 [Clostridia bacterium]|nr:hypothetical protein [Clostridia bacterium]
MSLKKIEEVKSSKWFSIWDLIAFGVVLLTAVALILAFTVGKDRSALSGFQINYRGEQVLTYEFGGKVPVGGENYGVTEREGGFTVRFVTEDKKGFNDIFVDTVKRTVAVTDSNCSAHKDCVHTAALVNNSSLPIICSPHGLTVSPLKFVDDGVIKI